ncbi:MAG: hypothetical protein NTV70_14940 [Acidobacteria bacterium]|nr:hypothetical protein [Acidobacteriota bacterium]
MKSMVALNRSLLALGFAPALTFAATAYSSYGLPAGFATAGVVCPPAISQSVQTPPAPVAMVACPNGSFSQSWAGGGPDGGSMMLSGESANGSISGAPAAVAGLLSLVTPTLHHSRVNLTVNARVFRDEWPVRHEFDVYWYGSDPGTALHLYISDSYEQPGRVLVDVTHAGPIDLHESLTFWTRADWFVEVQGSVIATSTPEPGTALLVAAALLLASARPSARK